MTKTSAKVSLTLAVSTCHSFRCFARPSLLQCLHTSTSKSANPLPITGTGPAPLPPLPAASEYGQRLERRRRQTEMLRRGKDRFWKEVSVQVAPEGHHTVHLDARPVRHPSTKSVLPIPATKPHLATAIALEWDLLVSAQQALRSHLVPLTSMASRAHDISLQDSGAVQGTAREEIVETVMGYLDTDTLLCWAPERSVHDVFTTGQIQENSDRGRNGTGTLREQQISVAQPIIAFLSQHVWPGVQIRPGLDDPDSIFPTSQSGETHDIVRGWVSGLGPWELAGLERAVLAGKSLCVGARLVVEWGEAFRGLGEDPDGRRREPRFGVDEASEACSLEVGWQTGMWGEVEDTHDVEKEDLRRQMGSVILIVGGTG